MCASIVLNIRMVLYFVKKRKTHLFIGLSKNIYLELLTT